MSTRTVVLSVMCVAVLRSIALADLPCTDPAADPCVLDATVTIPVGTFDIRPRSLDIKNKTITISGAGTFAVTATNIVLEPGARVVGNDPNGDSTITLEADGTFTMQSAGTSKSRIDASGVLSGGSITVSGGGDVTIDGSLTANASDLSGYGGSLTVMSNTGNISITGDPSVGLQANGNDQGGGGLICIMAAAGGVAIDTPLVAKGGDCSSCEIDINAGTDITTTAHGNVDMSSSGGGDGGLLDAEATGSITLGGDVVADGSGGSGDNTIGGAGGESDLYADGGALTVNGRTELNGASPDGDGGTTDFNAHTVLTQNGPIIAVSTGFGSSFGVGFTSDADATLAGEVDMTGDEYGGDVDVVAGGKATVTGNLHSSAPIDPVNAPNASGGTFEIDACQISIANGATFVCTGPGPDPGGSVFLRASTGMSIAGEVTGTSDVVLTWRTTAPTILGTASITPAPTIVQDDTLPCCGVACTTTTTTSTTSTSTLATTTTGPAPTSTSSTVPTPTSTTSSTHPTTSTTSTLTPTTGASSSTTSSTSSSTHATTSTTSTTSSTAPSSTAAPTSSSSTSTSSQAPSTVTTTTSAPLATTSTTIATSCLDTALGLDAVRCRLDALDADISGAAPAHLGGVGIEKKLDGMVRRANRLVAGTPKTRKLRGATRQLKLFSSLLERKLASHKVDASLADELATIATDAQTELQALTAP